MTLQAVMKSKSAIKNKDESLTNDQRNSLLLMLSWKLTICSICLGESSLHIKRFCAVWEQRITER